MDGFSCLFGFVFNGVVLVIVDYSICEIVFVILYEYDCFFMSFYILSKEKKSI